METGHHDRFDFVLRNIFYGFPLVFLRNYSNTGFYILGRQDAGARIHPVLVCENTLSLQQALRSLRSPRHAHILHPPYVIVAFQNLV